jgi:hypothetical protein
LIPIRELKIRLLPFLPADSLTDADSGDGVKQSKYIQEPQHHSDDYNGVQDRLDTSGHGDETIHQPQEDTHDDQGY